MTRARRRRDISATQRWRRASGVVGLGACRTPSQAGLGNACRARRVAAGRRARGRGRFERVDGVVVAMAPERASHADGPALSDLLGRTPAGDPSSTQWRRLGHADSDRRRNRDRSAGFDDHARGDLPGWNVAPESANTPSRPDTRRGRARWRRRRHMACRSPRRPPIATARTPCPRRRRRRRRTWCRTAPARGWPPSRPAAWRRRRARRSRATRRSTTARRIAPGR